MRRLVLTFGCSVVLAAFTVAQPAQPRDARETVEHVVGLLGQLRLYALPQYFTEHATVAIARSARTRYVNRVVPAEKWVAELRSSLGPEPFEETLSNVDVRVVDGEIATVSADFRIERSGDVESSGTNVFTLVRQDGVWKIASIAFTTVPTRVDTVGSSFEHRLGALLDALPAKSSLHAKHLPTGEEVAVRADTPMNTLSVIKIPVMVLAYRDAADGKLDLDERYVVKPEDRRRGSGLVQTFAPGLSPTWRDLITQMIITSDNTATDIVIGRVGLDRVNALLKELGYEQTRLLATTGDLFRRVWEMQDPANASWTHAEVFERSFPSDEGASDRSFAFEGDPDEWLGRTTAREMSRLLEAIHTGAVASREASDEMVAIMKRQFYSSRLPRFLRFSGVSVAHKTGDWPPIAGNDVGILYYDGGPTVVSVFVNQNRGDFTNVEATIGEIAELLVDEWGRDP